MTEHEKTSQSHRTWRWYVKLFFAFYAAGFACWLLSLLAVLFIAGHQAVEAWVVRFSGLIMAAFGAMWLPLIWRRLR